MWIFAHRPLIVCGATAVLLAFASIAPAFQPFAIMFGASVAHADDDGGGDDGGGDDGGGDDGGGDDDGGRDMGQSRGGSPLFGKNTGRSIQRWFGRRLPPERRSARQRQTRRVAAQPLRAEAEIVATGIDAATLDGLVSQGFEILAQERMALVQSDVVRLRVPPGRRLEQAVADIRAAAPLATADFNHFYRPEQGAAGACAGDKCLIRTLIDWPSVAGDCAQGVEIGLVDTAINPKHEAFAAGQVEVIDLSRVADVRESGKQHGTAVAALLVGSAQSRTPGLLPGARLVAVDAFHRVAGDDRADTYDLIRAIGMLSDRGIDVVNLSLTGPANGLLEQTVAAAEAKGILLVAAAGNKGPQAEPVYPAAYASVLAVTAVDNRKQVYRRANRGAHIDLAAPGVNVWTAASISGVRTKTGTSFAAPFATAAVAMIKAGDPPASSDVIRSRLGELTDDLGEPGKDPVYGWGLLNASSLCKS